MDDKYWQRDPLYRMDGEPWLDEESETIERRELGEKFIPLNRIVGMPWEPGTPPEWEKVPIKKAEKTLKDLELALKKLGTTEETSIWGLYRVLQDAGDEVTYQSIAHMTGHTEEEVKKIVDRVSKRFERRK